MTNVRGLDLSSTSTGVCHPLGVTETIAPKGHLHERCRIMADTIAGYAPADSTVIEAIGTRHVQTAIAVATVHALTLDRIDAGTAIWMVTPTQLKKWATGKGNGPGTDKVAMSLKAAAAGWEPHDHSGDDEADAWWLWTIGMALAGQWVITRNNYRLELVADLAET